MAYKKLSNLTTRGQNWNIQVKVMRMWDSVNPTTNELISLDMILMYEHVYHTSVPLLVNFPLL